MNISELSEIQLAERQETEMKDILKKLKILLSEAQVERGEWANKMRENQKLPTAEMRHSGGFHEIYSKLNLSEHRVSKLREALTALESFD